MDEDKLKKINTIKAVDKVNKLYLTGQEALRLLGLYTIFGSDFKHTYCFTLRFQLPEDIYVVEVKDHCRITLTGENTKNVVDVEYE